VVVSVFVPSRLTYDSEDAETTKVSPEVSLVAVAVVVPLSSAPVVAAILTTIGEPSVLVVSGITGASAPSPLVSVVVVSTGP